MDYHRKASFTWLLALAASITTTPAFAVDGDCAQWDVSGYWRFNQSNGTTPGFTLEQVGTNLHGHGSYFYTTEHSVLVIGTAVDDHSGDGPAVGTINGNSFELTVYWNNNTIGVYTGQVGPQGLIVGTGFDKNNPGTTAQWHSDRVAVCSDAAAPVAAAPLPAKPTLALGRIQMPEGTPAAPPMSMCESAASARAANRPTAAALEAQCALQLAAQPPKSAPPVLDQAWRNEKAARGAALASQDALATELRNAIPEGARRNGFDYGMAVAEHETANGPGKQAIQDALSTDEQPGYRLAVQFSVDRNANADLAAKGAAIMRADPGVAAVRDSLAAVSAKQTKAADQAVFYKLGFDIASALFGDPALGAAGNTLMGPGSLKVRNSLAAGSEQSGFDEAVNFHLARKHQ